MSSSSETPAATATTSRVRNEKKNGFAMFMDERRDSVLASGHQLQRGRLDLANLLDSDWRSLSAEEKQRYANLAKEHNRRRGLPRGPVIPKLSAYQRSVLQEADLRRAAHETTDKLFTILANMGMHRIVICSFTLYSDESDPVQWVPAEIGLTAMSIRYGVTDNFSRIIDPGKDVSLRALGEAYKRLSLPYAGTVPEFQDLNMLTGVIEDFLDWNFVLGDAVKGLPIFAMDSDLKTVHKCFEWIMEKSRKTIPLKILSLNRFACLASRHGRPSCAPGICAGCFLCGGTGPTWTSPYREKDTALTPVFVYPHDHPSLRYGVFQNNQQVEDLAKNMENYRHIDELSCAYHYKRGDGIYNCALVATNRYAFGLLEVLTLSNEVKILPNHVPNVSDPIAERKRRLWMLRVWGVTRFEEDLLDGEQEDEEE